MFKEGGCEYHGTYFDFPLRNVARRCRSRTALVVACSALDTIEWPAAGAWAPWRSSS
jgi:hypothetical protein